MALFGDVKSHMFPVPDYNGYMRNDTSTYGTQSDDSSSYTDDPFDAERDVSFLLYTRRNPKDAQRLYKNATNFDSTLFKKSRPTRFMIHGWFNDVNYPVNFEIRDAYLKKGDFNYVSGLRKKCSRTRKFLWQIFIDWSTRSSTILYTLAKERIQRVAQTIADMINFMIQNNYTTHYDVILVGHSMGAQAMGQTAKKIVGGKVRALFGLDPAGPLFDLNPLERIASTDAWVANIFISQ